MGISRKNSLKKRPQFLRVYERGNKKNCKTIVVYWLPGSPDKRFGFTVSRKIGNAVVRNKVKRRLSELVRKHFDRFSDNCWYVFNAKRISAASSFFELEEDFEFFFQGAHEKASADSY
ncbi:MAG: ribonuclease P protein component [Acidobacteria bacterium]|nr:ribonuclease P protein component [Acidobacteriota bacterium]